MFKRVILGLCVAAVVVAVAADILWNSFRKEREMRAAILTSQGQGALYALEGGIRSWRRVDSLPRERGEILLQGIVRAAPEILGLAVFDAKGNPVAQGGRIPPGLIPSATPQWYLDGLFVCKAAELVPSGVAPARAGGSELGAGTGQGNEADQWTRTLNGPVWLGILMDATAYHKAVAEARRALECSLALSLVLTLSGVGLIAAVRCRQRRAIVAELDRDHEERMKERSELGASLARGTTNPLTAIWGLAQSMLEVCETTNLPATKEIEELRRTCRRIADEADLAMGRVNSLLEYARAQVPCPTQVNLDRSLAETAARFEKEAASREIELRANLQPVRALADPGMFRQMMAHLLANALAACHKGDRIEITLDIPAGKTAVIAIRDTGEGILPEDLPCVFEPYFSRREGGMGLGLAIVQQIAQSHGWRVEMDSVPGKGATVRVLDVRAV